MRSTILLALASSFLILSYRTSEVLAGPVDITRVADEATTAADTTSSPTTSHSTEMPTPTPNPSLHYGELKTDGSNPILGDLPIIPDHQPNIINRRCKLANAKEISIAAYVHFYNPCIISADVPLSSCKELYRDGFTKSGLYVVQPRDNGGEFVVYCDMHLQGGGWTIIQRRVNKNLKFNRSYDSYKTGFGDFTENFWIGLDKINRLTAEPVELYIGLEAFFNYDNSAFARYSSFSVGNKNSGYALKISGYDRTSTADDSLSSHNNQKFSSYDRDQDGHRDLNCAQRFKGGWWYKDCHDSNLNGVYHEGFYDGTADGVSWQTWTGDHYSLKTTVLAIRPTN